MQPMTASRRHGAPTRRDPAPSRWAYRMQRVMLTPYLRRLLRVGLPSLVLLAACGLYLANEDRRAGITGVFSDLRAKFESRPEFRVSLASIEGCSPDLAEAVRARLNLNLPQSSFDLDLDAARARIEQLDAVKSAELRVRSGGVLQVLVTERQPVAVWRTEAGLTLVDDTGHRVAGLHARTDRPDLPLIAGEGADTATTEALQLIAAAGPLTPACGALSAWARAAGTSCLIATSASFFRQKTRSAPWNACWRWTMPRTSWRAIWPPSTCATTPARPYA